MGDADKPDVLASAGFQKGREFTLFAQVTRNMAFTFETAEAANLFPEGEGGKMRVERIAIPFRAEGIHARRRRLHSPP